MNERSYTLLRKTLNRAARGPFENDIGRFIEGQLARGYNLGTTKWHVYSVVRFGEWLSGRGLRPASVTAENIDEFNPPQQHNLRRRWSGAAVRDIIELVTGRPVPCKAVEDPSDFEKQTEEITRSYAGYLRTERGLVETTNSRYVSLVRAFLSSLVPGDGKALDFGLLRGADVSRFLLGYTAKFSPAQSKLMVCALRSFFRYLSVINLTTMDLEATVPTVPNWKLQTLPKSLKDDEVQRLLDSCDRSRSVGIRDYAAILVMARLGLRAGEVAHLKLDDINWESGELLISGKSERIHRLPITEDVGAAIAAYLQRARPHSESRLVFLRVRAPYTGFSRATGVSCIIRHAMTRAGLNPPRKGAHTLRHTVACQMLRNGGTLYEIGRLLRHQSPQTTTIYAKVDLEALRDLALPWIGGDR